ncbi:MAG: ABC transporter ATP-binding protein/permease, partial [Clostridiales bacterium]|nr:ABC transporter ATP-binding protein/permease [Clostridiales bacterium]
MIAEVTVDMIQPKLMADIVDNGILGLSGDGTPDLALIRTVGIRMILIVLAGGLFGMLSGTMANLCSQNFGNTIRKKCFDRIMHLAFEQTDAFTTGSLITRVTNDVSQLERLVQQLVRGFIRCLMFMVVGTVTLMSLNVHFLVIIACAFPLVLLDIGFILWKTNPLFTLLQGRLDDLNGVIRENIGGTRVVKAFIQEDRESARFETANTALVDTQLKVLILMSFLRPIMNIILNLATVALIWIGAIQVQAGGMQPGEVMAAVTYISQILNGMMMLAMIFQTLARGSASAKRIRQVLDAENVLEDGIVTEESLLAMYADKGTTDSGAADSPQPGTDRVPRGSVAFKNVSFTYPASGADPGSPIEVLHHVDLTIEPGETVAVIGATGCGKTSLVNLIPRFYDATEGTVEVDGVDVRDYTLKTLRGKISFVTQKNELFSTTIKDNITIGRPDASEEEIRKAAQTAQAENFILEQPDGYDTAVAESGMSLSGGQRQRVSIARALLKNAEILIFDDSTSALDLATEAALYKALAENYPGLTKIVIAQRIATARQADRIAVFENGAVAAVGTHEQLLASSAVYRD